MAQGSWLLFQKEGIWKKIGFYQETELVTLGGFYWMERSGRFGTTLLGQIQARKAGGDSVEPWPWAASQGTPVGFRELLHKKLQEWFPLRTVGWAEVHIKYMSTSSLPIWKKRVPHPCHMIWIGSNNQEVKQSFSMRTGLSRILSEAKCGWHFPVRS